MQSHLRPEKSQTERWPPPELFSLLPASPSSSSPSSSCSASPRCSDFLKLEQLDQLGADPIDNQTSLRGQPQIPPAPNSQPFANPLIDRRIEILRKRARKTTREFLQIHSAIQPKSENHKIRSEQLRRKRFHLFIRSNSEIEAFEPFVQICPVDRTFPSILRSSRRTEPDPFVHPPGIEIVKALESRFRIIRNLVLKKSRLRQLLPRNFIKLNLRLLIPIDFSFRKFHIKRRILLKSKTISRKML